MTIIIDEASAELASFFYPQDKYYKFKGESCDSTNYVGAKCDNTNIGSINKPVQIVKIKIKSQIDILNDIEKQLDKQKTKLSECIWIVKDVKQRECAEALGVAAIGEPDTGTHYAVENLYDIDIEYLERVLRRHNSIPWDIGTTDRCLIRELSLDDIPALYELYAKPGMTRYVEPLYEYDKEIEYEKSYIKHMYGFYEYGMWLVFDRDSGQLIGRAGLEHRDYGDETELEMGYMIAPEYQRAGYATEVCRFIIDYARENTAFERINCLIDHDNAASIQLVEKLGFEYAGQSDASGELLDRYILAI